MNHALLKMARLALMVASMVSVQTAVACLPVGGSGGERGGATVMSDGANVAWFEWSDAEGGYVQVQRWFDPWAAQLPIQPDEVDATDWLIEQGLLGEAGLYCGGWGDDGTPVLPRITVRPLNNPAAILRPVAGFFGRLVNISGAGRIALALPTATFPMDVPVAVQCTSDQADLEACRAIRGAVGTSWAIFRSWNFTAVFSDGRVTDYTTLNLLLSDCGIRTADNGRRCRAAGSGGD
jgi:hypothetical protein